MADWHIEGEYMETCNCAFLCPCITSNLAAEPTEGDCKAALALRVDRGEKDGVKLDGTALHRRCCTRRARWATATSKWG